jgi:hypothetical protein
MCGFSCSHINLEKSMRTVVYDRCSTALYGKQAGAGTRVRQVGNSQQRTHHIHFGKNFTPVECEVEIPNILSTECHNMAIPLPPSTAAGSMQAECQVGAGTWYIMPCRGPCLAVKPPGPCKSVVYSSITAARSRHPSSRAADSQRREDHGEGGRHPGVAGAPLIYTLP